MKKILNPPCFFTRVLVLLLGYLLCCGEVHGAKHAPVEKEKWTNVTISIDASKIKWIISKYLASTHLAYNDAMGLVTN